MPLADIDRLAHPWSAQRFGLFWGCDIHNPCGKTNLHAWFDYRHPSNAQAFEFFGASISTRHSNSGGAQKPNRIARSTPAKPRQTRHSGRYTLSKAERSPVGCTEIRLVGARVVHMQPANAGKKRGGYSARDRVVENMRSTAFRRIVRSRIRIGVSRSGCAGIRTQLAIQAHAHRQDAQRSGLISWSVIHTGLSRQCCSMTYCSGARHAIERYPRRTTPISR